MEFYEMKSLAKKAGMKLKSTTKKVEIQDWLMDNEEAVNAIKLQEEVKIDIEVPEIGETFEIKEREVNGAKVIPACKHKYVFTNIQCFREPSYKDELGIIREGNLFQKDVYKCQLDDCNSIIYKDKSERPAVAEEAKVY